MATNQTQPDVNSALQDIINRSRWRNQLATDYTDTATRLQTAYGRILPNLQASAGDLSARIAEWAAANPDSSITSQYVKGFKEYQDLLARVQVEMNDFASLLRNEAGITQERATQVGVDGALELTQAVSGGAGNIIASVWNRPAPEAIANAIGYVDSAAFRSNVSKFGENAAQSIADTIISGIAQGKSPGAISRILQNWFTLPYAWADNAVRTVQLWSYRTANHETYRQNADVIEGWMWWASLDDRTCLSCISQHGSIHPLSETLSDHHRGRCAPLPVVRGTTWKNDVKTGAQWFDEQSPATQRQLMGPGRFELFTGGMWDWSRASKTYSDPVFGDMLRQSNLGEMTG